MTSRAWVAVLVLVGVACGPGVNVERAPRTPADASNGFRQCAPQATAHPGGLNFDLLVASSEELFALFPGSLPPRTTPRAITYTELRNPFDGTLLAGPFDPPLVVHSYAPDGPWPTRYTPFSLAEVSARKLPWVQCGGLYPSDFEALGDALGLPTRRTPWPVP